MAKTTPDKNLTEEDLKTPSAYYKAGESDRQPFEDRAELISKLTLPYAIRDDSDNGTSSMEDATSQSYGGRLTNTLKAKMGMALLPPSASSFRYTADSKELTAMTGGKDANKQKFAKMISSATTQVNQEIELQQIRSSLFEMIIQLEIVGSVIVEKVKGKGVRLKPLKSFVVTLESDGEPIKMCFVEVLKVLPDGVMAEKIKEEYELYTMCTMDKSTKRWTVVQEIEGEYVGKEVTYKNYDAMPFRYFGWTWMVGDKYHRPFAEDYYHDLRQLDMYARLLTDGAVIAAKMLLFVNERGGRTRKDEVADSENGDVIDGSADDVTTLKTEKNFDFQMPMEREAAIKKELAAAFLMNESVTREAERVTAEEIRYMAQQLETSSLAGIYSKLSLKWSKWIVEQIMLELDIKFDAIEVEILTGLDALGRSQEATKLDNVVARAEAVGELHRINKGELLNRYASFEGVDTNDLFYSDEEVAKQQQANQQKQAEQVGAEAAATAGGQAVGAQAAAGQPQQTQG